MPDVFANITQAPPEALAVIANVLEMRAALPQQQDMLRTYLRDIAFPPQASVLEVGCGTERCAGCWRRSLTSTRLSASTPRRIY